jgi:single-stranded DNA-binding protein
MISRVFSVRQTSILYCLIFSQFLALPAYSAQLYKWVDENGQIRYSDNITSDQSKKAFQTLTPDGRVLSTKEASKPPEQIREERAEKNRQAEELRIKAEVNARLAAMQEHHDNVLLMTFTNEKEILVAQDERLSVIDSVIQLLKKNINTEQEKLQKEEARAKALYLDKNLPVPGGQAQKIEYFTEKVLTKQQHLSLKIDERDKVKQQYIQDLIRYRELTKLKKQKNLADEAEKARLKEESFYK